MELLVRAGLKQRRVALRATKRGAALVGGDGGDGPANTVMCTMLEQRLEFASRTAERMIGDDMLETALVHHMLCR